MQSPRINWPSIYVTFFLVDRSLCGAFRIGFDSAKRRLEEKRYGWLRSFRKGTTNYRGCDAHLYYATNRRWTVSRWHPSRSEPNPRRFRRKKVGGIVDDTLKELLEGKEYDEDESKEWCISVSDAVKSRIKSTYRKSNCQSSPEANGHIEECHFPRYKLIVQVVIGQQKQQDVRIASRCLWDNDHDNHASGIFNNVRTHFVQFRFH